MQNCFCNDHHALFNEDPNANGEHFLGGGGSGRKWAGQRYENLDPFHSSVIFIVAQSKVLSGSGMVEKALLILYGKYIFCTV